jgi:hypothetical protein
MRVRVWLAATVLVVAGALLFGAGPVAAASGQPTFKASFSGTALPSAPNVVSFTGSGSATLMGRITTQGQAAIEGLSDSCPGGIANVNTEILTDNDGDTLTIVSDDVACPVAPGLLHGTGRWTVSGGTGRFSGATGSGSLDGYSNFNTGTFNVTLAGTVTSSD